MPAKEIAAAKPQRVPPASERNETNGATSATGEGASTMPPRLNGEVSADAGGEDLAPWQRPGFVRQPFGSMSVKLAAPERKGFHRHWFNDHPGRIDAAVAAGYAHVKDENTGGPRMAVVGVAKGGGGLKAYLMEIPEKWFQEDMRREQAKVDEIDKALRGGDINRKDNDERYVPKSGIKISEENVRVKGDEDSEEETAA